MYQNKEIQPDFGKVLAILFGTHETSYSRKSEWQSKSSNKTLD